MSTTLSYGVVKPATGDKGSAFFPALEGDLQQLNDHTHNGANSAKLTTGATVATQLAINPASWVSTGTNGLYRQLITIPPALNSIDEVAITFRDSTTRANCLLRHEYVSATTYYVYTNDNTLSVTAVYMS